MPRWAGKGIEWIGYIYVTAGIRGCVVLDHNVICNGNYLINLKK